MIISNWFNLPDRIIKQLSLGHKPIEKRISVTTLIDAPRIFNLQLRHWDEITCDYSDFLSTLIGISVHERQDKLAENDLDVKSEEKFEDKVDGVTIVGKSDNYTLSEKIIRETKVKAVGCLKYNDFITEVTHQLNVYAWQRRKRGYEVKGLELDVYYRNWTDWEADRDTEKWAVLKNASHSTENQRAVKLYDDEEDAKTHAKKIGGYTQHRESSGYPKLPVDFSVPISLWTFEEQNQYIEDQIEYFQLAPMDCDNRWKDNLRCKKYCKVRTVCEFSPYCLKDTK